jgi:hypothetical protein
LDWKSFVASIAQHFFDRGGEGPKFTAPSTPYAIDLFFPQDCGRQAQPEH